MAVDPEVVVPAAVVVEPATTPVVVAPVIEPVTEPVVEPVAPVVEPPVTEPVVEPVAPVTTPPLISKEEAQKRIDRMYARLQVERSKRVTTENNYETLKNKIKVDPETGEEIVVGPKHLTQAEAEAIWDRKENERKFKESETKVLLRHPTALNDDGSFNMNDPFTKMYIDIGRQNQSLAFMVNGPELAEAMVEKHLGPAARPKVAAPDKSGGSHTGKSTVAVTAAKVTQLSDVKRKIAARMGMTEVEYIANENKIRAGDKRVGSSRT